MQPGHHRPDGDVEDLRGVGIAELADVDEHDDVAKVMGDVRERVHDRVLREALDHPLLVEQLLTGLFGHAVREVVVALVQGGLVRSPLDAPTAVLTADYATSLRASTSALGAALDAAAAGKADNIMVTSGETRVAEPITAWEQTLGDGAGAALVGEGEGVVAEFLGSVSLKDEIMLTWRQAEEDHVLRWEDLQ